MGGRQSAFASFVVGFSFVTYLWSLIAIPLSAVGWPTQRILSSLVMLGIEEPDGTKSSCSAFSVSQEAGRFVTAAHCAVGNTVRVGDIDFAIVDVNADADVALLQASRGGVPALKLGHQPKVTDSLLVVGHTLAAPEPFMVPNTYQGTYETPLGKGICAPCLLLHGDGYPGMSGGPIVNTRGDVVSVVLGGMRPGIYDDLVFGTPYAALRQLLLKWRTDEPSKRE